MDGDGWALFILRAEQGLNELDITAPNIDGRHVSNIPQCEHVK